MADCKKTMASGAGFVRRQHEARNKSRLKLRSGVVKERIELDVRLAILNEAFETALDDATCKEVDAIAEQALGWTSEIAATHQEVPDDMIARARLIYPQDTAMRVFEIVAEFHANNMHLTPDEVVDFISRRMMVQPQVAS